MQHSRLFHGRLRCREHVVGNSDALITQKRSTHCFRGVLAVVFELGQPYWSRQDM